MLCCGKKKKKGEKKLSAENNKGYIDDEENLRSGSIVPASYTSIIEREREISGTKEERGQKIPEPIESECVQINQGAQQQQQKPPQRPVINDNVKGILLKPNRANVSAFPEGRKRSRTVSFSLPDEEKNSEEEDCKAAIVTKPVPVRFVLVRVNEDGGRFDKPRKQCLAATRDDPSTFTMSSLQVPMLARPAPAFKGMAVVDGQFKEISLADYKGKYLVLFFYPLDFTFVCPTEIIAFSQRVEEFRKLDCEVVACSTDSQFTHLAWINTPRKEGGLGKMDIPLLADKSMEIARSYGVLKEDEGLTFRGLFIIDRNQVLRQATINDLPVGRDVDETLRLVQAYQFVDEHGEVCPAGWKPGARTMKADPAGSKEYFQSEN